MSHTFKLLAACAVLALLALGAPRAAHAQAKPQKELSAEQLAQIEQAMPKEAPAKPRQPRKVLVITRAKGFFHDSIPVAAKALEIMGQKTGAFAATVSDDPAMFAADTLKGFDAVIMDNTTGQTDEKFFRPDNYDQLSADEKAQADKKVAEYKESFVNFVKSGKGLVGIHSATDCCYNWADYGEMMGGFFNGHPWHCVVPFKLDLPGHVLNKSFGGKGFSLNDEIYIFKEPYAREKLLVLVSLDTPNLPPGNTGSKNRRPDGDYAVSWVHKYGQGRVFYCSLGHDWPIFWNPDVLGHYLAGIQYALGDLDAPDDPALNKK